MYEKKKKRYCNRILPPRAMPWHLAHYLYWIGDGVYTRARERVCAYNIFILCVPPIDVGVYGLALDFLAHRHGIVQVDTIALHLGDVRCIDSHTLHDGHG